MEDHESPVENELRLSEGRHILEVTDVSCDEDKGDTKIYTVNGWLKCGTGWLFSLGIDPEKLKAGDKLLVYQKGLDENLARDIRLTNLDS